TCRRPRGSTASIEPRFTATWTGTGSNATRHDRSGKAPQIRYTCVSDCHGGTACGATAGGVRCSLTKEYLSHRLRTNPAKKGKANAHQYGRTAHPARQS